MIGELFGRTVFFRNTGSTSQPAFAPGLTGAFGLTDVGFRASPVFRDFDGDGDSDALIANFDGNVLYFENKGTPAVPAFRPPVTNPFGFASVETAAKPAAVDLDADGDDDVVIGAYSGRNYVFENDPTVLCQGLPLTQAPGGTGNDVIFGTTGDDVLSGGGGNDRINGLGGNDAICGGGGNDTLLGRAGDDRLFGGSGNDVLVGGGGNDRLVGQQGIDELGGGPGDDVLLGGGDQDALRGDAGNDRLDGGPADDVCIDTVGVNQFVGCP